MKQLTLFALSLLLFSSSAFPCTAFVLPAPAGALVAKNYDWDDDSGLVVINPRGVQKKSIVLSLGQRAARWTSKYSSLTFNQYGPEFPNGGMNERGLVVEILWLDESKYPRAGADGKPGLNQVQWIQYILDTSATLDEAIAQARAVHVSPLLDSPTHYMICDRTGDCAAFEYLKENLEISRGARTLANHTYAASMRELATYDGFGGRWPVPERGIASLTRFAVATKHAAACPPASVECAFSVLKRVHASDTKWSIVYDTAQGIVHFKTDAAPQVKTINLNRFDGRCGQQPRILDLNALVTGDVSGNLVFAQSSQIRRLLMQNDVLKEHPVLRELIVLYPRTMSCGADLVR